MAAMSSLAELAQDPSSRAEARWQVDLRPGRLLFGPGGKLPSILVPCRFEARFKPLRFSNEKLSRGLGWRPTLSYAEALQASGDGE